MTRPDKILKPSRPKAGRRRPERLISVDEVLEVGLRIADGEGLNALSMRRVADELGVGAMTIYSYVRSKEEMLDGIATRVLGNLPADDPSRDGWRERLELAAHHLHVALRDHPGVAQIVGSHRGPIPALDHYREKMLGILLDAGIPAGRAGQVLSALAAYAAGFAHIEQSRAGNEPSDEVRRLRRLPRDEFPHLSDNAEAYANHVSQEAFTLGLRSFIAGLVSD
ncbi:MAG TPA: TetR/AcrR family transcriptional regulator C-terminal domain-containing protein [Pseudonocardia sp.]|jgi:AcrR family transcriptional regulator